MLSVRLLFVVIGFIFYFFRFCLFLFCHASTLHFGSMFWQEHMIRVVPSVTSFSLVSTIGVGASAVEPCVADLFCPRGETICSKDFWRFRKIPGGLMCCAYDWKCMILWANRFSILAWEKGEMPCFFISPLERILECASGTARFLCWMVGLEGDVVASGLCHGFE